MEHTLGRKLAYFLQNIKREENLTAYQLALLTAKKIKSVVSLMPLEHPKDVTSLIQIITEFCKKLIANSSAVNSLMVNISRRILHIIRDESKNRGIRGLHRANTLNTLLEGSGGYKGEGTITPGLASFKAEVINQINELIDDEVLLSHVSIADQARDHIHSNEVLLTFGMSKCVKDFLVKAREERSFEVFVVEAAPLFRGHLMAKDLADAGIPTILIPDSSIYAMMSRVNKVIIGTQLIMANGGLKTFSGAYGVCLAAHFHSVPVLVVCGLYKLSPFYPFNHDNFNEMMSPGLVIQQPPVGQEDLLTTHVPTYDYVPPELISLYITNEGAFNPFYIYRLLSEHYSQEDTQ
jgi:translation initiation factor eIF-2B subunit beta